RAYLEIAGHGDQPDGPMFRPLRGNAKPLDEAGRMDPDAIDRMVRKYAAKIGLGRGYSAHSMRATFITTALENGAKLEDVQKAAGHRDPSTTKLYDRRGYNPEKGFVKRIAWSEEFVGDVGFRQLTKCGVQGDFRDVEGAETVRFSHGQFGLVVQTLHHAAGELLLGAEIVQDQPAVRA